MNFKLSNKAELDDYIHNTVQSLINPAVREDCLKELLESKIDKDFVAITNLVNPENELSVQELKSNSLKAEKLLKKMFKFIPQYLYTLEHIFKQLDNETKKMSDEKTVKQIKSKVLIPIKKKQGETLCSAHIAFNFHMQKQQAVNSENIQLSA